MGRKKQLRSTASRPGKPPSDETLDLKTLPPTQMVVSLPENASGIRNLNFAKWYGHDCDIVVYATQCAMERMAQASIESGGKTRSASSIATYYGSGLSTFLPYCATVASVLGRALRLDDLDRHFMEHYIAYLRQSDESLKSQSHRYSTTKSVLAQMAQSNWIAKDIFPRNPFPNSNRSRKGQAALSEPERRSVLRALKRDMRTIVSGTEPLTSEELITCLLAIAARTGLNPTPALQLLTDCLQPHPIKANRYVLIAHKRRGNATHIQSLRRSEDIESIVSALPDVARIIDLVIERNATIRKVSNHPKSLFVYESRSFANRKEKCQLTSQQMIYNIKRFVDRHQLRDADGRPLKLNLMRLRKTFENRLFTLSGQDPFLTAKLGGHSTKVSNDHYLEAPESAEKDWRLMGEIRTEELLNYGNEARLPTQNTPVGRCRDTLHGELAPKDGKHCQRFLACFRCHSFVVTGDDLYRVFSLYWMLIRLRQPMGPSSWKRVYGHIIRIIDKEIAPKFDADLVDMQRQRAKVDPHPFWRDPELLDLEGAI